MPECKVFEIADRITLPMSIVSVVMCIVAIAVLTHFRLHRSFNYRLILYLLVSFLLNAINLVMDQVLWVMFSFNCFMKSLKVYHARKVFMQEYSLWNILLCIAFMTAEIFTSVVFFVELRKAEIPLTITCFTLPIALALVSLPPTVISPYLQLGYVPGMFVACACVVATAMSLVVLACRSLRGCVVGNREKRDEYLLHQHTRQRYCSALKESLLFIIYPVATLLWLLNIFLFSTIVQYINDTHFYMDVLDMVSGCIGAVLAAVFFVHIKIIGWHRLNAFRSHGHVAPPVNPASEFCEDLRLTCSGGV